MMPRQSYRVYNCGIEVLVVAAYTAEGACNIAAIKLGIPVSNLEALLNVAAAAVVPSATIVHSKFPLQVKGKDYLKDLSYDKDPYEPVEG